MKSSRKLPDEIREEIYDYVFSVADHEGYLTNNRQQNRILIQNLVINPKVGQLLEQFMPKGDVRVYIKDAVLNRYTKIRRSFDHRNLPVIMHRELGLTVSEIDHNSPVSLFRASDGKYIVVSIGTSVKWETALKKMLLYIGAKQNLLKMDDQLLKCVLINTIGIPIPPGDTDLLIRSLKVIGVGLLIV